MCLARAAAIKAVITKPQKKNKTLFAKYHFRHAIANNVHVCINTITRGKGKKRRRRKEKNKVKILQKYYGIT